MAWQAGQPTRSAIANELRPAKIPSGYETTQTSRHRGKGHQNDRTASLPPSLGRGPEGGADLLEATVAIVA